MTTGLDDCGPVHPQRRIHTIMGMAAQKNVDACDFRGELHVLRKAEVREHDDEIHALPFPQGSYVSGQFLIAERETKARAEMCGHRLINDRSRDANDAHAYPASLNHRERRIGKFAGVYLVTVTREQRMIQLSSEFAHPLDAVSEIPMPRPGVQPKPVYRNDKRLAFGLDGVKCSMKRIPVIQRDHRAVSLLPHSVKDREQPRISAQGAIFRLVTV